MDILIFVFLGFGMLFFLGGAVGIVRMPDFYSRLHPAGKLDTMGLFLVMLALAIYTAQDMTLGGILTGIKILLIVVFVFLTSPTATHAIIDAGVRAGLEPWTKFKRKAQVHSGPFFRGRKNGHMAPRSKRKV